MPVIGFLALLCLSLGADTPPPAPRSPADLSGPWQLFVVDADVAE
jgi:hypothetical protein